MKSWRRVLLGSLLAAAIGTNAFSRSNEAVAVGSKANERIILVGANGHDTVGGLMPLPLWPRAAIAHGTMPAKPSWKRPQRR
jgi:hypothetical protein